MINKKNDSKKSLTKLSFQDADKVKGGSTSKLSPERLLKLKERHQKYSAQTAK